MAAKSRIGVQIIDQFKPFRDARGTFQKVFRSDSLSKMGFDGVFRESFVSYSEPGVVRGMHAQLPPSDHWKLVSCVAGEILDVCIDLREGAKGRLTITNLSVANGHSILIPPGFAHGFATLGGVPAGVLYLVSSEHDPARDSGIRFDSIGFDWRGRTGRSDLILSDRDRSLPSLAEFASPW